jgi:hypothetical protein
MISTNYKNGNNVQKLIDPVEEESGTSRLDATLAVEYVAGDNQYRCIFMFKRRNLVKERLEYKSVLLGSCDLGVSYSDMYVCDVKNVCDIHTILMYDFHIVLYA